MKKLLILTLLVISTIVVRGQKYIMSSEVRSIQSDTTVVDWYYSVWEVSPGAAKITMRTRGDSTVYELYDIFVQDTFIIKNFVRMKNGVKGVITIDMKKLEIRLNVIKGGIPFKHIYFISSIKKEEDEN